MSFDFFKQQIREVITFREDWDEEWWNIQYMCFKECLNNLWCPEYRDSLSEEKQVKEWALEFYQEATFETHNYWLTPQSETK